MSTGAVQLRANYGPLSGGNAMSLRRRILTAVAWNVSLFVGPLFLFHLARWITLWGAYEGWWALSMNMH